MLERLRQEDQGFRDRLGCRARSKSSLSDTQQASTSTMKQQKNQNKSKMAGAMAQWVNVLAMQDEWSRFKP